VKSKPDFGSLEDGACKDVLLEGGLCKEVAAGPRCLERPGDAATWNPFPSGNRPSDSADYFGVFCEKIARLIGAEGAGPPFVAMISNGTSGDANCIDFDHAARKFDYLSVAEDVSRAAYQAYPQIQYHDWVPLAMEQRLLELNVRMPSKDEVAQATEYIATELKDRSRAPGRKCTRGKRSCSIACRRRAN